MWRSGVRVTPPSRGGRKNPETPSLPVCSCETVVEQKTLIGSPIRSAESGRLSCGPTLSWPRPTRSGPPGHQAAQVSETPRPQQKAGRRCSSGGSQTRAGTSLGAQTVKSPPADAGDPGSPGWGRPPGGGHGDPLQHSRLEKPADRGAWRATYHPWGTKKPDTTQRALQGNDWGGILEDSTISTFI